MTSEKQYCTFFVSGHLFGVEVPDVREILPKGQIDSVPLANEVVAGLVNHRGQIVTAIDLRKRLELPASSGSHPGALLIARADDETISLLVDRIGDVISVKPDDFEATPQNLQGNLRDLIIGVYKLPGYLLLPLNLEKVTEAAKHKSC